jgi:altronate dehydratase large subunit
MMCSLCTHPNVGAVLLFSLGCEGFNRFGLEKHIRESDRPVRTLVIQENEGTRQTITRGRRWVEEIIEKTPNRPKECASLGELVVGTICGGSDGTSGITANPAVGSVFDELVSQGATYIFEETGELIGCEEHMQTRAISSDLGLEIQRSMEKAALYYSTLGYGSFAPGNADGGLSSVEENPWEPMPNLDIVKFMGS